MLRGQMLVFQYRLQNLYFFSIPLGPLFEYCANQSASIYEERPTNVGQVALLNRRANNVKGKIRFRTRSREFLEENIREFRIRSEESRLIPAAVADALSPPGSIPFRKIRECVAHGILHVLEIVTTIVIIQSLPPVL